MNRATRLVTPGGWPRRLRREAEFRALARGVGLNPARCGKATESATENRPPAERSTVAIAQGNLSDAEMHATLGKGEKVG